MLIVSKLIGLVYVIAFQTVMHLNTFWDTAVDNNKKGITRGVIAVQSHPLRPSVGAALIVVGTSGGSVAVLESLGR